MPTLDESGESGDGSEARRVRAERYFERDLAGQREWYGDRARVSRSRARALGITVVGFGAATSLVQVFGQAAWVPIVTAVLGTSVAIAEGWRQIVRYEETWIAYRAASERMKRERRLYTNKAGAYRDMADEDAAFLLFVESVEMIVAQEQQLYWQDRGQRDRTDGGKDPPVRDRVSKPPVAG